MEGFYGSALEVNISFIRSLQDIVEKRSTQNEGTRAALLLPFDELDCLEGLVHVPNSEIEAEVEHGVPRGLVALFQADKVSHRFPGDHLIDLHRSRVLLAFSIGFRLKTGHRSCDDE